MGKGKGKDGEAPHTRGSKIFTIGDRFPIRGNYIQPKAILPDRNSYMGKVIRVTKPNLKIHIQPPIVLVLHLCALLLWRVLHTHAQY